MIYCYSFGFLVPLSLMLVVCCAAQKQFVDQQWLSDPTFSKFFLDGCDFPVVDGSTIQSLLDLPPWMQDVPILFTNLTEDWLAANKWTKSQLIASYGERSVKSGSESSIVHSGGAADIDNTFKGYLDHLSDSSNNDYFLFDTTILHSIPELKNDFKIPHLFADWDSYKEETERSMWHMLSLGPSRSGLPFHNHGKTWISVVHGTKHWFIYPVGMTAPLELTTQPNLARDFLTVEKWLFNIFPKIKNLPKPSNYEEALAQNPYLANHSFGYQPFQCAQGKGDTLYIPSLWSHLTINEGETIAIGGQQALYDGERLKKSQDALDNNLGTFEVLKDIGLAIFNMATVDQEDLTQTFDVGENGVVRFASFVEIERYLMTTLDSLVVLTANCGQDVELIAASLKASIYDKIEIDIGIITEPVCDGSLNPLIATFFAGLTDAQLQNTTSKYNHNLSHQLQVAQHFSFATVDEAAVKVQELFYESEGAFGSIFTISVQTKLRYKDALQYYWKAFAIRPYHPETMTMVIELAGLSDDFTTMLEVANKTFDFFTPLSRHLTNTSIASIYHNVGKAIMGRGLHDQALPFLQRSLESVRTFRPALKSMIALCSALDMKSDALSHFYVLSKMPHNDDISEYANMVNPFITKI